MCISIVFAVNLADGKEDDFKGRIYDLGLLYEYGISMGQDSLLAEAEDQIMSVLSDPDIVFEVHDLPEPHCACDIDDDIRLGSKLGKRSRFFDFVRETLEFDGVKSLSVLFFQEEPPDGKNLRTQLGVYEDFVDLLNRWNTWQEAGFEPTRRSHHIAEATPFLYTFTDKQLTH